MHAEAREFIDEQTLFVCSCSEWDVVISWNEKIIKGFLLKKFKQGRENALKIGYYRFSFQTTSGSAFFGLAKS